jgi:hypothetical protein
MAITPHTEGTQVTHFDLTLPHKRRTAGLFPPPGAFRFAFLLLDLLVLRFRLHGPQVTSRPKHAETYEAHEELPGLGARSLLRGDEDRWLSMIPPITISTIACCIVNCFFGVAILNPPE